ncbi:uncharacterized protein [Nicotiana tomentosiformis]|uniref:uncharacterized protein n=1 Tax=Nicotiana tomentosiformis TaxID=4098 RepID=UPI00388CDA4B
MAMGHLPSLPSFYEEALKEARELKTPDIGYGSGAADPFKDCFTGVDDSSDIGDASLLLEEAQHFITWFLTMQAISRFRVDLSQCEAELRKVLGERDALRLLCSKTEEAIKDLQADLAKVREERVELDQQLRNIKQKVSVQTKKIDELEIRLAEAKAEVESSKVLADKSIIVHRADADAAQVEAREAAKVADARAHWVAEIVKCRSRRETLEEIHARGFDLTEEARKEKELEAEAEALASDDDDDDDDGSKSGSKGEEDPDPEA